MKEIIERLITLLSGITPTEIEMLILLLWIKILYDIEKKSRVKNSWSNVKTALVFLSTTGSFILGLLWTGPKIARFPQQHAEGGTGPLCVCDRIERAGGDLRGSAVRSGGEEDKGAGWPRSMRMNRPRLPPTRKKYKRR